MVKPGLQMTKLKIRWNFFKIRKRDETQGLMWAFCHDKCHKVFPFTELGKNLLSSAEVSLKLKLIQSCIPIKR